MARRGSGLGFVIVIITLAIVAILVGKAWKTHAPAAIDVTDPGVAGHSDHGQPDAARELSNLPDLTEMQQETNAHAQQVQDALAEIE